MGHGFHSYVKLPEGNMFMACGAGAFLNSTLLSAFSLRLVPLKRTSFPKSWGSENIVAQNPKTYFSPQFLLARTLAFRDQPIPVTGPSWSPASCRVWLGSRQFPDSESKLKQALLSPKDFLATFAAVRPWNGWRSLKKKDGKYVGMMTQPPGTVQPQGLHPTSFA